jgi:hypothetical protein
MQSIIDDNVKRVNQRRYTDCHNYLNRSLAREIRKKNRKIELEEDAAEELVEEAGRS